MRGRVVAQNADGITLRTDTRPPLLIHYGLQPALLTFVFLGATSIIPVGGPYRALAIGLTLLVLCERIWPARMDWVQTGREWLQVVAMFAISGASLAAIEISIHLMPKGWIEPARLYLVELWPQSWPLAIQAALGFSILQFMAYWLHRWQHEIGFLWRTFGHGTHHTYEKLSALNWNTAHPFEALFLVLPAIVLGAIIGVPDVAIVAATLVMIQTAVAHTNLRLNERVIGLVLTTNSQHMQHHSAQFSESQTNYGCAMTFWDRVFGTLSSNDTIALGDPMEGERTLWKRLTLPLRRAAS